jgi:dihydrofolate reductase
VIALVLAVASNGVIGKNNDLPWPRLKGDMKFFRDLTMGGVVVMGSNTWRSLPKRLDGRINIVVSRTGSADGADRVIRGIDEIPLLAEDYPGQDIFIIGGASIYAPTARMADTAFVTRIEREYDGDAVVDLPALLSGMRLSGSRPAPLEPDHSLPTMTFETYRRSSARLY